MFKINLRLPTFTSLARGWHENREYLPGRGANLQHFLYPANFFIETHGKTILFIFRTRRLIPAYTFLSPFDSPRQYERPANFCLTKRPCGKNKIRHILMPRTVYSFFISLGATYLAVYEPLQPTSFSGVPANTRRPPSLPPSGPRSIT